MLGPARLKVAAALVLTAPFVPMLFQGEEWGASSPFQYFTDHVEPELRRAVSEGRQRELAAFGWDPRDVPDPQDPETFMRSKLRWQELDVEPHGSLLDWHRRLIRFRRETPALADGRLDRVIVRFDEEARWLVMERDPVLVACNLADRAQRVPAAFRGARVALASDPRMTPTPDGLELPPDSVAILDRTAG